MGVIEIGKPKLLSDIFSLTAEIPFLYWQVFIHRGKWNPLIYLNVLNKKETTETTSSASFLDVYLTFYTNDQLSPILYDNREDFSIFHDSKIAITSSLGVFYFTTHEFADSIQTFSNWHTKQWQTNLTHHRDNQNP